MTVNRTTQVIKNLPSEEVEEDDLSIEYPETDDMPMPDNDVQMIPVTETLLTLRGWFSHRSDVYVAANMFVYYRMNDNRTRVGPDAYAVIGNTPKYPRGSWLVWREGKPPDFVLEVASPSTWRHDVGEKRNIYAGMGVTEYWRFEAAGGFFTPVLVGERLEDGEYRPLEVTADDDGILRGRSAALGLDICVLPGLLLRFYDPEGGRWLTTYDEEVAARQAAEAALQEELAARQALEEEVRQLRQRLQSGE